MIMSLQRTTNYIDDRIEAFAIIPKVKVCLYVYICMSVCINVCMYVYMLARMYVCIHTYMYACMYALTHMYSVHVCTRAAPSSPRPSAPSSAALRKRGIKRRQEQEELRKGNETLL